MTNNYITPYYDIPSSKDVIGEIDDYQTLTQDQIIALLEHDYTKNMWQKGTGSGVGGAAGGAVLGAGAAGVAGAAGAGPIAGAAAVGFGGVIALDYLFNMGTGLSKDARGQILSAWVTAQETLKSSIIEAKATCYAAEVQAMAATNAAIADANARMYEADMNYKAVQEQCKADIEIAKMELEASLAETEVKADQVNVDMARVRVEQIAAEGAAEKDKDEGEAKLLKAQASLYDSGYDYLN